MHSPPPQYRLWRRGQWLPAIGRLFRRRARLRSGPSLWRLVVASVVSVSSALGAFGLVLDAHDLRHGITVAGIVTDTSDDENDPSVTVSFDVDGVDHECTTTPVQGHPAVSASVRLRYVADDPEGSCAVGNAGQSYAPASIAGGVSAFSTGWLVTLIRRRRRARKAEGG